MPLAIVYGHSQAQPSGMGDQMVAQLKARGWDVKRVGLQGRNDAKLLAEVDAIGDVTAASKVFLYCAGNADAPQWQDTLTLIDYFGASRTVAIFPPINFDRDPDIVQAALDRRAANLAHVAAVVPVYYTDGHDSDFKADRVHMLPNSAPVVELTTRILAEQLDGSTKSSGAVAILIAAALAGAAFAWWRRKP